MAVSQQHEAVRLGKVIRWGPIMLGNSQQGSGFRRWGVSGLGVHWQLATSTAHSTLSSTPVQ